MESKHTKGKWAVSSNANWEDEIYYTINDGKQTNSEAEANAERIVECVNNYDALKEENERLKDIAYDLTGKVADLKDIREQENFKHKEENERLKEALHNLYNFTLGKEGYLDSCLNDAEYALYKSTVKEDGNNEKQAL